MNKKNIIIMGAVVVLVAGASFYGGMQYANSKKAQTGFQRNSQGGQQAGRGGNRGGAGLANGDVLKMDDKSITIKMRDGGSKIIYLSDSTSILKSTAGSKADVAVGENVMVSGSANQDGSITAQSVQIRPAGAQPGGSQDNKLKQ